MSVIARDARKLSADSLEDLRRRAVAAVESGTPRAEVARLLCLSRQTVSGWVRAYHVEGDRSFRPKRRGRRPGEQRALSPRQQADLVQTIVGRLPDQVELPYALWTRQAVGDLIRQQHGLRLTRAAVGRYLRLWGFGPLRPRVWLLERHPATIRGWLETVYPRITTAARAARAEIVWVGRAAGPGGSSVLAGVSNRGPAYFAVYPGPLDPRLVRDFVDRLGRRCAPRLHVVIDRDLVPRAGVVRAWLKDHDATVHLLPP